MLRCGVAKLYIKDCKMEDIIVDEPAPVSVRSSKNRRFRHADENKRDWGVYLFDWLVKGLIIALLLGINFLLFASAGNFSVFSSDVSISPEVLLILGFIFALALILMFLISFSSFVQNVVAAVFVGFFVYIMLGQFALFDKFSFLAYLAEPYLGNDVAANFMTNSDVVAAVMSGLFAFVFFAMAEKKNIAYFMGILVVVFGGIVVDEYFNRNNHQEFKVLYDNSFSKADRGKKFVYIMMPNAASISYLEDMKEVNADVKKVEKVQNIMLGFFAKNNFKLYQNAFVFNEDPFMNAVRGLNGLSDDKEESFLASAISLDGYWKFKNPNDEYVYLNDNQLYNVFRRAKYKISAYKTRGIDLCGKNGVRNTDRCVEKVNTPISFSSMNLSVLDRAQMLTAQWLQSMGVFNNLETIYTMLKAFTRPDNMPMIGFKFDSLYVVNSPEVLETLAKDIVKDKGNQAYFVLLDMPSNMFVYNEYCKIKPKDQWLHMESLPWVINKNLLNKRTAYLDQSACMYGKLEQFMEYLQKSGVLDETVIVLQGLSGADDLQNVNERLFVPDFKNKKLVTMAIRDPLKKKFSIGEEVCEASDILNQYLFRKGNCQEMRRLVVHSGAKKELKGMLGRYKIDNQMVEKAQASFGDWYKLWATANKPKSAKIVPLPVKKAPEVKAEEKKIEIKLPEAKSVSETMDDKMTGESLSEDVPDELLPPTEAVVQERNVGEAPVMDKPVADMPEQGIESLKEKMTEDVVDDEKTTEQDGVEADVSSETEMKTDENPQKQDIQSEKKEG